MKTITTALLLALTATASTLTGCAADGSDDAESTGDALSQATVGADAVAVEIHTIAMAGHNPNEVVTIALPSKMHRILTSLKKRAAGEALPRCMAPSRTELHFLDAKGKETSKASLMCGYGDLTAGGRTIGIKTTGAIDTIVGEPLTAGDALWGITSVKVAKPGTSKSKTVTDASEIEDMLDAVDADQEIKPYDPTAPVARCLPSYIVTFKRGTADAAVASFNCGDPSSSDIRASFDIPAGYDASSDKPSIASGYVQLDPRPFAKQLGGTQ